MTGIIIRECTMDDIDDVFQMHVDWANEQITYGQVAAARERLVESLAARFYVADHSGDTVGFAYGSSRVSEDLAIMAEGERYFEIEELYV